MYLTTIIETSMESAFIVREYSHEGLVYPKRLRLAHKLLPSSDRVLAMGDLGVFRLLNPHPKRCIGWCSTYQ